MISFIGAGRVAKSFGKYLFDNDIAIAGYYDISSANAAEAARQTNSTAFSSILDLLKNSSVVFISTNDDAIAKVAEEIKKIKIDFPIMIGHFSGMHSSDLLSSNLPKSYICFSLHPMQSFSGRPEDLISLKKTVITLEGDERATSQMIEVLKKTGNRVLKIRSEQKILYHAAGVVASNYLTTVVYKGINFLEQIDIDKEMAREMLEPLVRGTVENIFKTGPEKSLTGPIARGDVHTVSRHIEKIAKENEESLDFYKILGQETLKLASLELLKDDKKINELNKLFKEGS